MSKYQKLDSALAPTMHDDEYDESFSLYLDDDKVQAQEQQLKQQQQQQLFNHNSIRLNAPNNGSSNNNNNNSETTTTTARAATLELEDHTWEVPLLRRSSSNNSCSHLHMEHETVAECRCMQPGFGADLKSKSSQDARFKILLAVSLCGIFMIIEFLGGYMAGSLAIMADAAHLATDCISFIIGLVAIWLGSRPPDARMSFGYKRFEVLGALLSILGIWLLTAMLVFVAVQRIYSQEFQIDANVMMCISAIGIAINIVMMFVLHGSWFTTAAGGHGHSHSHGHSHTHVNSTGHAEGQNVVITNGLKAMQQQNVGCAQQQQQQQQHNLNLRAAMIHVIGDLVQSIGVFLAAILIKCYPAAKYADPLCTLLFSLIVIMTTVRLFRESLAILLDAVPPGVCLAALQRELHSIEGVKSVHHLNVWQHTSEHSVLMAHLVVESHCDTSTLLRQATDLVCGGSYNIKHVTIQIEQLTEI